MFNETLPVFISNLYLILLVPTLNEILITNSKLVIENTYRIFFLKLLNYLAEIYDQYEAKLLLVRINKLLAKNFLFTYFK